MDTHIVGVNGRSPLQLAVQKEIWVSSDGVNVSIFRVIYPDNEYF